MTDKDEEKIDIPLMDVEQNNNEKVSSETPTKAICREDTLITKNELHHAVELMDYDRIKSLLRNPMAKQWMNERDELGMKPFHIAVINGNKKYITLFLENGANLASKIKIKGKVVTAVEYMITNLPRSVEYLEDLFDKQIKITNHTEITDEDCEININFDIFLEKKSGNQMRVLSEIVNALREHDQSILLHPLVQSFLFKKWKNLRILYFMMVFMYSLFVFVMTWMIMRIYKSTPEPKIKWVTGVLSIIIIVMILMDLLVITILFINQSIIRTLKRPVWLLSITSKILLMVIMVIDHSNNKNEWPKVITAVAGLLSWFEIMILISHIPECGTVYQMFSIVVSRAMKVFFLFGLYLLIGFSIAFWVIFHDTKKFINFADTFIRTIVMISEFEFVSTFESLKTMELLFLYKCIYVLFIFFVSIVMMNLILGLIISDVKDLEYEGKMKIAKDQISLMDTLSIIVFSLLSDRKGNISSCIKLYPAKPFSKYTRVLPTKIEKTILAKFT